MSQDNSISKESNSDVDQVSKLQNTDPMTKKVITACLGFTYCAFVLSFFFSNINVTHKFEKDGKIINIQHLGKYDSPLEIKHAGKYDSPLEIQHSGKYKGPVEVKHSGSVLH